MNNLSNENLNDMIAKAKKSTFKPLKMTAQSVNNEIFEAYAYNEVSLMRQTHLASKIKKMSGGFKSFFALSGSDANEGAIKLAFAYHQKKQNKDRTKSV